MPPIKNLVYVSLLLACFPASAGKADFELPIEVTNQSQFLDVKRRVSILRGNVSIKQGSLKILADEIEVHGKEGQNVDKFIAQGSPASYQQTLDDGSNIKASADKIEYDVSKRIITLSGDAQVQQNASLVTGDSISINMELEQVYAQGNQNEQVKTIFQPESFKKPSSNKPQTQEKQP